MTVARKERGWDLIIIPAEAWPAKQKASKQARPELAG